MKFTINRINSIFKKNTTLPSVFLNLPIITITENEIAIEQHYKLLSFSNQQIQLKCENGIIAINGNKLTIKMMYAREIILEGVIKEIIFHK